MTRIVRTLLAFKGQQQADLAGHLEMDSGSMSRALNGKRRWTLDDLVAMGDFFGVSPALFFEDPQTLIRAGKVSSTQSDDGSENYLSMDQDLVAA